MEIGNKVNYIADGQSKSGDISWKSDTHVYIKDENNTISKINTSYVSLIDETKIEEIKPSEKKGLISSFLSLFR